MADEITTATEDGVCWITLNRAEKRNALTTGMIGTLRAAVESAAGRDTVRVIVVRGAGAAFCAGLDLRELAAQRAAGEADTVTLEHALESLERCPQPTIAAVQGTRSRVAASSRFTATSGWPQTPRASRCRSRGSASRCR